MALQAGAWPMAASADSDTGWLLMMLEQPGLCRDREFQYNAAEAALDGLATRPAERVLEVRYEAVVTHPMAAADALAEFLGTPVTGRDALRAGLARQRRLGRTVAKRPRPGPDRHG